MTASLQRGLPAVLLAGTACFALDLVSVSVGPGSGRLLAVAVSAVATALIPLFWVLSAFLIDRFARSMGGADAFGTFKERSGTVYLLLIVYSALGTVATATNRWLPASSEVAGAIITLLAFAAIGAFIALTARIVHDVYRVPGLNAVALTFFPYAVLSAGIMAAILVISILHGVGLV